MAQDLYEQFNIVPIIDQQRQTVPVTDQQVTTAPFTAPAPVTAPESDLYSGLNIDTPKKQELLAEAQKRGLIPQTTPGGIAGAITRGAGPYAAGAALGAMAGAPVAGVGAIPGAMAGMGAVAATEFVGDPIVSGINSLFGTKYTLPSDALEDLFTKLGVPEPKTEAERIVQTTAAGASAAGGMAALGKAIQKGATGVMSEAGRQIAAQPVQQVLGGAGGAAAGQLAKESDIGPVGQAVAGLAGGVGGAATAGVRIQRAAQHLPSDIATAEKAGIDLMTSDVLAPRTFAGKWLQSTGERIPLFGTGGVRRQQQEQRVDAVKDVLRDFGADDAVMASDEVMKDLAGKHSADLTKYATAKHNVIDKLGEQGNIVPIDRTVTAIDDEILKLEGLKSAEYVPIINRLTDWKTSLQDQDLSNVELLRKQIGESFKAPELAGVKSIGEKSLSNIYGPLRQDMGDFIKAEGNRRDFDKWDIANKRLSKMQNDMSMGVLKSTLKQGDMTPETIDRMIFSKKPSEIKKLYSKLTPTGRANARASILSKIAEKSGGIENISPDRFANEVKRYGDSVGVFFSGGDLTRIKGLTRALNATKRAAQAEVAPPTGVQVALPVGAAVLTDLMGGTAAAIGTGATVGLLTRLYESPAMRDILIKIPKTKIGSPEEAALLKRFVATTERQSLEEENN